MIYTFFAKHSVETTQYNNNNDDDNVDDDDDDDDDVDTTIKRVFKEDEPKSTNSLIICFILVPGAAIRLVSTKNRDICAGPIGKVLDSRTSRPI